MAMIGPEDYLEPSCLLCGEPFGEQSTLKPIPQERIIAKVDELMSRRDYIGAERTLLYWLGEADAARDRRGELFLRGELVGHYRKTGEREKAFQNADRALELIGELGFEGTVSAATAYVNCATAMNAFGENERSIELFRKAVPIYEKSAAARPDLLGGLYNNMGLTLAALGRYSESEESYKKALAVMGKTPGGELEEAMTLLNLANLVEAQIGLDNGESRIFSLLDEAWEKLDCSSVPHDGYYAFVCEKCAPTFEYYGYFLASAELNRRSEEIYERA